MDDSKYAKRDKKTPGPCYATDIIITFMFKLKENRITCIRKHLVSEA